MKERVLIQGIVSEVTFPCKGKLMPTEDQPPIPEADSAAGILYVAPKKQYGPMNVKNLLPGQTWLASTGQGGRKAKECRPIKLVKKAAYEIEPPCPHADPEKEGCGGCHEDGEGCGGCPGCPEEGSGITGKNVGRTVRAHYRGTFNDGTQFDSSYDRGEPLEFVCGAGMMIRGFDAAVADMEVGQTVDVHLMPSEAYGEVNPEAIFTVEIDKMPGAESVSAGQKVYLQNAYGQPFPVTVTAKDEKTITFDANHEMAGKELNFRIELVEIL